MPLLPCRCSTCGLLYTHCPGHFGHIELAVPVYNPLVFGCAFCLMRSNTPSRQGCELEVIVRNLLMHWLTLQTAVTSAPS